MVRIEDTIFCDGCGIELYMAPVMVGQKYYCCKDCSECRECDCGARQEFEDERRESTSAGATGGDLPMTLM